MADKQQSIEPKAQSPPIGSGALAAFLRQGAKELAQVLPALPDSMRIIEEPGTLANLTPQEVYATKNNIAPQKSLDIDMDR